MQQDVVTGQVPPTPTDARTLVFYVAPGVRRRTTSYPFTGRYLLEVEWPLGSPGPAGQLYVLRGSRYVNGQPTDYDGWASRPITLTAGTEFELDFAATDLQDPNETTSAATCAFRKATF